MIQDKPMYFPIFMPSILRPKKIHSDEIMSIEIVLNGKIRFWYSGYLTTFKIIKA